MRPATSTRALALPRAASRLVVVAALAQALSACSVSYPLYSKSDEIKTGSIAGPGADVTPQPKADAVASAPLAPPPGAAQVEPVRLDTAKPVAYAPPKSTPDDPAITPSDWVYARGALSLAMGADAANASVPWANPDSGAYGSFVASAAPTTENGATCRPFAASHSGAGREQRLEGTACRTAAGYWEAVAIKAKTTRIL
ncbi:RT0821/Lpp0805 family surface protein [Chelatococcus sambhunathii]|nr:RT0821/Lpp0805 family surface protein [Chelatococcus sambhunathii]